MEKYLLFVLFLTLQDIGNTSLGNPIPDITASSRPLPSEDLTLLELFQTFNLERVLPHSPFQRFLIQIGRLAIVGIIVFVWLFIAIHFYVYGAKCCIFMCNFFDKKPQEAEIPKSTQLFDRIILPGGIRLGKREDYQKNYINKESHAMPILIYKK